MPLEVYKQGQENAHSLLRRFSQKIKRSRIRSEVRKRQFKTRNKSRQLKKRSALRRERIKKQAEERKEANF